MNRTRGQTLRAAAALVAVGTVAVTAAPVAQAATTTILIEFSEVIAGDGPGGTWNKYSTNAITGPIVDATGAASSITLARSGQLNASANAGTALTYDNTAAVGNPAWVATTTNNNVAGDLFFTDNGATATPGQVVFTFGGLTAGNFASVDFLGARNIGVADGFYEYSVDGGSTWFGLDVRNPDGTLATGVWTGFNTKTRAFDNLADGYTAHRYMNINDVPLTGTTFQFRATDIDLTSGNFAALNAMRLVVSDVPEPTAIGLLAVAAAARLGGRRRRTARVR